MDFLANIIGNLFDLLFDGFWDLLTTIMCTVTFGIVDVFNRGVTDIFSTDLTWFNATFPMIKTLQTIIMSMAISLALLSCVWQLFRSIGGSIVGDVEEPWIIIARLFIFLLLIVYSQELCNIALDFATGFYTSMNTSTMDVSWVQQFKQIYLSGSLIPESQDFLKIENESGVTTAIFNLALGFINWVFESLLGMILLIPIIWNYFKLLLEAAERYITMCVMYYSAPLALSMGVSKSTSNITKSWTRMYGCSLLMLILNVWSLKLFASAVQASGAMLVSSRGNLFLWCLTLYGFLKVAQHLDEYLSAMGLSVAKTGGSLLDDAMGTISTLSHAKDMVTGKNTNKQQEQATQANAGKGSNMNNPSIPFSRNGSNPQGLNNTGVPLGTGNAYLANGKQVAQQVGKAAANAVNPTSTARNTTGSGIPNASVSGSTQGRPVSTGRPVAVPLSPNSNIPGTYDGNGFGVNIADDAGGLVKTPSGSQVEYSQSDSVNGFNINDKSVNFEPNSPNIDLDAHGNLTFDTSNIPDIDTVANVDLTQAGNDFDDQHTPFNNPNYPPDDNANSVPVSSVSENSWNDGLGSDLDPFDNSDDDLSSDFNDDPNDDGDDSDENSEDEDGFELFND